MKTTTILLLLFISSFTVLSQDSNSICLLKYQLGNNAGLWEDNTVQQVCKGGRLKITCFRMANVTYQWKKNGVIIPNENKEIYYATEEGVYTAEAQTGDCLYVTPKITLKHSGTFENLGMEVAYAYESIKKDEFTICDRGEFFNININNFLYQGEIQYQWQKDGVDIEGSTAEKIFINKEGVYSVRARQGECLSHARPLKINIKNEKLINPIRLIRSIYFGNLNPKDTLYMCENTKTGFSSIYYNSLYHKWYKNNNLVDQGLNKTTFVVSESGVYNYETVLPNGCEVESEKIVVSFGKKLIKPAIQLAEDSWGCLNNRLSIYDNYPFNSYLQSTVGEYKISWFKNSVFKNSGWETYLSPNESGLYKLTVNIGTCSVEDTFRIDANKPVVIKLKNTLIRDGKITMCPGNVAALRFPTLYGRSINNYKLQWYRNGILLDPDTTSLSVNTSGRYYAIYRDINNTCVQYSDTVEVKVLESPAIQFDKQMLSTCSYRLVTNGGLGSTFAWKKDGKFIPGANSYEFFPKEPGNYSLVSNQGYCSYESRVVSVEMLEKSALTEKTSFCENDTLKLKAPDTYSYLWKGPDNFTSNLRNPKITNLSVNKSGIYKLTAFIGDCEYKDSVYVRVNASPKISIERADEYCLGKSIIMIARIDNGECTWEDPHKRKFFSSLLNVTKSDATNSGVYKVTAVAYNSGCSATASTAIMLKESNCGSIELIQSKKKLCQNTENEIEFNTDGFFTPDEKFNLYGLNYYSGDKVLLGSSDKSPIKFKPEYNFFPVLMIEGSKSKIYSNIINAEYSWLYFNISYGSTKVCTGYSVPLKIDSVNYKFDKIQWLKDNVAIPNANQYTYNATESGSYYVKLERDGCVSIDSVRRHVNVIIGEIEKSNIHSASGYNIEYICNGFSSNLIASEEKIEGMQYQWQLDGKDIPNATQNTYLANRAGTYSLKKRQKTCEAISNNVRLIVGDLRVPLISSYPYNKISKKNIVEICEGVEINLSCNGCNSGEVKSVGFQWQKDNIDIPLATKPTLNTKESGTFRLKVFQGDCIAFSNPIIVKYGNPQVLNLSSNNREYCIGEEASSYISWSNDITSDRIYAKVYKDNQFFVESQGYKYIKLNESGNYSAVLSYTIPNSTKTCTAYSDTLKIQFKDKVASFNISGVGTSTCLDSVFIRTYTIISDSKSRYQWKLNGTDIPEANSMNIMAKQSGVYHLEIQSNSGCTYLSNPLPIEFKKLDVRITKYAEVCYDGSFALWAPINSIVSYYYKNENYVYKPFTYEWKLNGKVLGTESSLPITNSGNYVLTCRQGACVASDSLKIDASVLEPIIPKILNPDRDSLFICPKGSVNIEAPKGDFTYSWLKNNQALSNNQMQNIKVVSEGTYKVWMEKGTCGRMSNVIIVKEKTILPTAIISGNNDIMPGDSAKVKVDFTSLPPWTIKLTNDQEFIANATPFEFSVKPLQTTVYELASVKNDCGVGTVSGKAEIKIIILGNEELAGAKINLYPVPAQGICQLSVETNVPEKLGFQLYNVEGKMLMKSEESKSGKLFTEVINLETMPDGVYVLKIKVGAKVVSRKIIKGS